MIQISLGQNSDERLCENRYGIRMQESRSLAGILLLCFGQQYRRDCEFLPTGTVTIDGLIGRALLLPSRLLHCRKEGASSVKVGLALQPGALTAFCPSCLINVQGIARTVINEFQGFDSGATE